MVVAEKVQQPVQREHPQLGLIRMTGRLGLAPGDAGRDDDIAQPLIFVVVGKREDVGRLVFAAILAVERAHAGIAHEGDADLAGGARRRRRGEPTGQAAVANGTACAVAHRNAQAFTVGIHRTTRRP